jgi:diaminohydroxyphosphoribosylaminopyrimidine deaminase/5-amino-6-(5-phosphoribosylamino)uracil reductase
MNTINETYMQRCIELAKLGAGNVAPNPMVGAVLVHKDRIIGEGYHEQYGQAHAEVNCINSVCDDDKYLITESTLYVSLEPCAHHGKTPPCADLVIRHQIKKVVVGCRDPFKEVDGKGIEKLRAAGVEVHMSAMEQQCIDLNKRFFTFHTKHRPYIVLKWAQSNDLKIASLHADRLLISNDYSNKLVHKWRSEEAAILVGTNTAMLDDPSLTNRLWHGNNPIRLLVDMQLRIPPKHHLYNNEASTVIFNLKEHSGDLGMQQQTLDKSLNRTWYYQITEDVSAVQQILHACYRMNIQSILVEGGSKLLQSFIDEDMWDEARTITNTSLIVEQGLTAPVLKNYIASSTENIFTDRVDVYLHKQ